MVPRHHFIIRGLLMDKVFYGAMIITICPKKIQEGGPREVNLSSISSELIIFCLVICSKTFVYEQQSFWWWNSKSKTCFITFIERVKILSTKLYKSLYRRNVSFLWHFSIRIFIMSINSENFSHVL